MHRLSLWSSLWRNLFAMPEHPNIEKKEAFMTWFHQAARIVRAELALFQRFPKLRMSVLGIVFIPALYSFIYLSSVWDPTSHTEALQALIVNQDQGFDYRGQPVNLGRDLVASLQDKHTFGFQLEADEARARAAVQAGQAAFALIIPAQFSANAVPGTQSGGGKLIVFASEGNNYSGAGLARRFAVELGHQLNETLNEKRWALVLGASEGSKASLSRLREGVAQLQAGAHALDQGLGQAGNGAQQLAGGSTRLSDGLGPLTSGVKQLGEGLRTMESKMPNAQDLQALKSASAQLASAQGELGQGLGELHKGAQKLTAGAQSLKDDTQSIPVVGGKVSAGAGQLAQGGQQLVQGLDQARTAQAKITEGQQRLNAGVTGLADGVQQLGQGVGQMTAKLPTDAQLNELNQGGLALKNGAQGLNQGLVQLQGGAHQLSLGLDTLAQSLPAEVPGLEGSAKGLAASVEPEVEIDAPVPNNGTGFAPNFVPVSLWLGAVMTSFVFHLRRLPLCAQGMAAPAQLMGKGGLLGGIVLAQAGVILLMLTLILEIKVSNLPALALTLGLASLTFMLMILALTRAFGDAGKAVGLILLIVQLSSAGGIFPVELTGAFFREISPWLPFTWVVRGIRASMFGAYGAEWLTALWTVGSATLVAGLAATFIGRWKIVGPDEHRPAMDI